MDVPRVATMLQVYCSLCFSVLLIPADSYFTDLTSRCCAERPDPWYTVPAARVPHPFPAAVQGPYSTLLVHTYQSRQRVWEVQSIVYVLEQHRLLNLSASVSDRLQSVWDGLPATGRVALQGAGARVPQQKAARLAGSGNARPPRDQSFRQATPSSPIALEQSRAGATGASGCR